MGAQIDWDEIARQAGKATDQKFRSKISSLTSLNDSEIERIITESGISKKDLTGVLKIVKDNTLSNNKKEEAIRDMSKGVDVLIRLASVLV